MRGRYLAEGIKRAQLGLKPGFFFLHGELPYDLLDLGVEQLLAHVQDVAREFLRVELLLGVDGRARAGLCRRPSCRPNSVGVAAVACTARRVVGGLSRGLDAPRAGDPLY
jgi:hypothetical protein